MNRAKAAFCNSKYYVIKYDSGTAVNSTLYDVKYYLIS